jgi:asparagine synthase (glutamine-hydrolysing)
MGFAVPLARWFRGPLRERVQRTLDDGALAESGLFNRGTLQRIAAEHFSGAFDHSTPIWALLMFESFLRVVLVGEAAAQPLHKAA